MADVDMADDRLGRLEQKVDGGFASIDKRFDDLSKSVDRRFDEVYVAMSEGFAEHRRLLLHQLAQQRKSLIREVGNQLEGVRVDMTSRFDRLESKLDAFVDAQAAVNRTLLGRRTQRARRRA